MDCVLLAGGLPTSTDPLYPFSGGKPKALIPFGTSTIIEHVLEALRSASEVHRIAVVGLQETDFNTSPFQISLFPDSGDMVDNILTGVKWLMQLEDSVSHALFCTADIPLLTGPIVDRFIGSCSTLEDAVYYSVVTKNVMEKRFPNSGRTFSKLDKIEISGGNLIVARPDLVEENQELLRMLVDGRKHAWEMARVIGLSTLLKFILRRLSVQDIEQKVQTMTGCSAKIVVCDDAEIAMDIDNPHQLQLLNRVE